MEHRLHGILENIDLLARKLDPTRAFQVPLPKWQWKKFIRSSRFLRKVKPYIVSDKGYIESRDLSSFLEDVLSGAKEEGIQLFHLAEFKRRAISYYRFKGVKWIHMSELEDLLPLQSNVLMKYHTQATLSSVDFVEIWGHYDINNSGVLDYNELQGLAYDLLINKRQRNNPKILEAVSQEILRLHCKTHSRKLTMTEMAKMLNIEANFLATFTGKNKILREELDRIFDHYDRDKDGTINGEELTALVSDLLSSHGKIIDKNIVEGYTKVFLREAGKDQAKEITKDEIRVLFASRRKSIAPLHMQAKRFNTSVDA